MSTKNRQDTCNIADGRGRYFACVYVFGVLCVCLFCLLRFSSCEFYHCSILCCVWCHFVAFCFLFSMGAHIKHNQKTNLRGWHCVLVFCCFEFILCCSAVSRFWPDLRALIFDVCVFLFMFCLVFCIFSGLGLRVYSSVSMMHSHSLSGPPKP